MVSGTQGRIANYLWPFTPLPPTPISRSQGSHAGSINLVLSRDLGLVGD